MRRAIQRDFDVNRLLPGTDDHLDGRPRLRAKRPQRPEKMRLNPIGVSRHGLYSGEDLATAPEVLVQLINLPALSGYGFPILAEDVRIGMAKAENRLVDVSHGEEPIRRADQVHELPLQGVGVLQLVHQDLIETAAH